MKSLPGMEKYMSSNVARLSPVQCAVKRPEPAKVERDRTNGRFFRMVFSALKGEGSPIEEGVRDAHCLRV
jgi:hypothetical protein